MTESWVFPSLIVGCIIAVIIGFIVSFLSSRSDKEETLEMKKELETLKARGFSDWVLECLGDPNFIGVRRTTFNVKWIGPYLVIIFLPDELSPEINTSYIRDEFIHFFAPYCLPLIAPAIKACEEYGKGDLPALDVNIEYYISKTLMEKKLADGSIIDKGNGNYEIVKL